MRARVRVAVGLNVVELGLSVGVVGLLLLLLLLLLFVCSCIVGLCGIVVNCGEGMLNQEYFTIQQNSKVDAIESITSLGL